MDGKLKEHNRLFREAYLKLNTAQRQAVDAIDGPVLVIAGPGTGKTQILAARIGQILKQTDTKPGNILCLTYTETGKVEMRNRLFTLIGSAAYRVSIHTFHSFCNEVIQDNLSYFSKQNSDVITALEEMELFEKLLNGLSPESPLKSFKEDNSTRLSQVKDLFSLMKKQAWEPEFLNSCINNYISKLPEKEEYRYKRKYNQHPANSPKEEMIREETERMEKLRAAVYLYPEYNKQMKEKGRYTYDDMILWVLNAFTENNNLLLNYQERYLYFLVDEFQDTSGSQKKLLDHLADYWGDKPNVFAVGDDDQSIYSFQDANVENMIDFERQYKNNLKTIVLTENYRSSQVILDYAAALISNNKERLPGIDKKLHAANPGRQQNITPEIIEYPNVASELIHVAGTISELIEKGVQPKDIAVIYRNHNQVEGLEEYLVKKGTGVNMKRNINILELPFVKKMITLLTYLANEDEYPQSGEDKLFELLHFDFFGLSPLEIARITLDVSRNKQGAKTNLRTYINKQAGIKAKADLFNPAEMNEVKRVSDLLESLIGKVQNETLQVLFEELVREAGILNYIMKSPDKNWLMEVLRTFFNFIKQETHKAPDLTLRDLLNKIGSMNKYKLPMGLQKISAAENGVNLMTAHGSKGAEFEYVFLIRCNENSWGPKARSGNRFKLPDNLTGHEISIDELEEGRRLFYVAMTRAKSHLRISYPVQDDDNKALSGAVFVSELMDGTGAEPIKMQPDDAMRLGYIANQFGRPAAPKIEVVDKMYVKDLLEKYSLSVTHLNHFLDCPIKFYYQNLIKVPSAVSESMAFGTVIHSTLQRLFESMKANNGVFPSTADMLRNFEWNMERQRASFTKEQYKRRTEHGKKILPSYYERYLNSWNKNVRTEVSIRNVEVEGVPINGKLDKLEFNGNSLNVVDYKTGSYDRARPKLKGPNEKEPMGGDYWRQAVFYKILLDNNKLADWKTESVEFDFVEPVKNEYKTAKIMVTAADVQVVTEQITDAWGKIQNQEFSTGCGKKECEWCNFVKDNNLTVPLRDMADEE
jgi:DNA helicase-2/ATP-dependent DNA helicase PcrA